jgi:Flp pilus assembly protein TadB
MAAPDLNDPAERARYHRELSGIGRGIRRAGLAIGLIGAVLVLLARKHVLPIPMAVAVIALGVGVLLMISGLQARSRYHQLRMLEPADD